MKNHFLPAFSVIGIIIFLGQGCQPILNQDEQAASTQSQSQAMGSDAPHTAPTMPPAEAINENEMIKDTKTIVDTRKSIYEDFTQAKYDVAITSGDPVYLYFFATWCPTCRGQAPVNERLFSSYNGFVHAFRVNILDNDVNAEEEAIAKQYNVNRQHTSILIDKKGNEAKRTIGTRSNTQLLNDLELITQ
jgi:thioredoxin